jgi:dTDP-4-dehydrorhamnose reductase
MTTRVLILGGGGMLGHKLWQRALGRFETTATVRSAARFFVDRGYPLQSVLPHIDVRDGNSLVRAFASAQPDVVVNCIGVIKQTAAANDPLLSISCNSLLPHQLADLCTAAGARLIHISTDCVFSGRKGMYTEGDMPDAEDLYGRSKLLGEVDGPRCLTLRTSIIGRELSTSNGLVEWFLSNRFKSVNGYSRAIFSGLTTIVLADLILDLIDSQPDLRGVYQVSEDPIGKYDLLHMLNDAYDSHVQILHDESVVIDRSLDSSRFRAATSFAPQPWPEMIAAMAADPTPYDEWRNLP